MCCCTILLQIDIFLFTMLVVIAPVQSSIRIQEAGVKPLERGDIGIVFRFAVENEGLSPVIVSASMVQCCEIVHRNETDCEHMKLVPSQRLLLTQGSISDLHLLYPTLYPHQRKGSCLVEVISETAPGEAPPPPGSDSTSPDAAASSNATSGSSSLTRNVTFDTTVFLTVVPPILKNYYGLAEVKWRFDQGNFLSPTLETEVCDSADEDPMDMCLPVDCIIKYSGSRSYFDPKSRFCVEVPLCESNTNSDLPTVAYHPMSNICLDLENPLTEEDIEFLTIGVVEQESSNDLDVVDKMLRCHKGNVDGNTCICHSGWETYSKLEDIREPPLPEVNVDEDAFYVPLHMCTIQAIGEGPPTLVDIKSLRRKPEVIPVLVVATMVCIIMMFMAAVVLCWLFTRPCCFTCWKIKKTY